MKIIIEDVKPRDAHRLLVIPDQLDRIEQEIRHVNRHEHQEARDLSELIARVSAASTVQDSIKVLIEGLAEDQSPAEPPLPILRA